ncbi:MAG: anti-sigma factor family protein [Candidatus Nanopelagicales bacterium]
MKLNPSCCPDLAEKISALIDDELTAQVKEEVQKHLVACAGCNETYEIEIYIKNKVYQTNQSIKAPSQLLTLIQEEVLIIKYKDETDNG